MERILKNIDLRIKDLDSPMLNNRVEMHREIRRILENMDLRLKRLEYRIQKLENLHCKHFIG